MENSIIIHFSSQALWFSLILSLPVVVVSSVVGLIISLLQALTQIQDQTLQFLIKLIGASVTLFISYHWMGDIIISYTKQIFEQV
ncbi:MAG: type III secretion system export apparatus subunit SctS [Plesiomonas sp.]